MAAGRGAAAAKRSPRAQPVQHRVEQLAALVDRWPPAGLGLGDQGAQDLPLGVGQVGAVAAAGRHRTLLEGEGTVKRRSLQPRQTRK
jgi:hypothetical protein